MEATFDEETTLIGGENKTESTDKEIKGWKKVAIGGVSAIYLAAALPYLGSSQSWI